MRAKSRYLLPLLTGALLGAATDARAVNNTTNTISGVVTNGGASDFGFPNFSGGNKSNLLQIINGGVLTNGSAVTHYGSVGYGPGDLDNTILVTGPGSAWTNAGLFAIGSSGVGNGLIVSNYGAVIGLGSSSKLGEFVAGSNNYVIVTDHGLFVASQNPANAVLRIGESGASNALVVTTGGAVRANVLHVGANASSSNNYVKVQHPGSTLFITQGNIVVGSSGRNNRMEILDGAVVTNSGSVRIGDDTSASNNSLLVSGPGSLLNIGATLALSSAAANNQATISNGALVSAHSVTVNASGGGNKVIINSGGILEGRGGNWSVSGSGNLVSNNGGVYQFTVVPSPGGVSAGGVISLTDGTMSFRGMTNANVFISGSLASIAYDGNNTFRLNSSSNIATTAQNYTFNTGSGATNYVGLELVNGTTLWRSQRLTVGANGSLLASNTVGTVAAVVTNFGSIEVKNSVMTWSSNVVIGGRYQSDPSTNIFAADVTVAQGGTLSGGVGDRFEFNKSLFIHSTNSTGFNLASSAVAFTGGGMHTNAITGQDFGTNALGFAANFAYGELHLGSSADQICFECGNIPTVSNNGLYVGWLDLLGDASLVTNLHAASGINIYYDKTDVRNAYLGMLTYQLTDCNFTTGGGSLIPVIPEPTTLAFLVIAAMLWVRRAHR